MKNLFALFSLLFVLMANPLKATHITGGELRYEHFAGTLYKVELYLFRENAPSSAGLPSSVTVQARPHLFPQSNFTLSRSIPAGEIAAGDGGYLPQGVADCIAQGAAQNVSIHYYSGTYSVPFLTDSVYFLYSTCCRTGCVDNLLNCAPLVCGNNCPDGIYIDAALNRSLGENSLPEFIAPPTETFCTNTSYRWANGAIDAEGDSLYYKLIPAREAGNQPLLYDTSSAYDFDQPILTQPGTGGVRVDSLTGDIEFVTASTQHVSVVVVEVEEFRRDTATGNWKVVGRVMRDVLVIVTANCSFPLADLFAQDSISVCGQTSLVLRANTALEDHRWSNGSFADSIVVYSSGWYRLEALYDSSYNCYMRDSIYVDFLAAPAINTLSPDTQYIDLCSLDSVVLQVSTPLQNPSVFWTDNGVPIGSATSTQLIANQPGAYQAYVLDSINGCVSVSDTLMVIGQNLDTTAETMIGDVYIVPGQTYTYTANNQPQTTYTWTPTEGLVLSGQGSSSVQIAWNTSPQLAYSLGLTTDNGFCADSASRDIFDISISVEEVEGIQGVRFYPIPFQEELIIEHRAGQTFRLYNLMGQPLREFESHEKGTHSWLLTDLNTRVYILEVENEEGVRLRYLVSKE